MPYNLIPASNKGQWNEVLSLCGQYDIYHTSEYHQIAQENGEGEPWLFWFWKNGDHIAIPLLLNDHKATSVYGYPGIITSKNYSIDQIPLDLRDEFQNFLLARNITSLFIRQNPFFNNAWYLDFMCTIEQAGQTVAIDLTQSEEKQLADMTKGHRHNIRKAREEGVKCIISNADKFPKVIFKETYDKAMQDKGAQKSYIFSSEYYSALATELREHLVFCSAVKDCTVASMALFFKFNGIIQYHLSVTPEQHKNAGGAKVILDEVRQWGAENGYKWLHLGGGLGASEESPLFRFKAGFSSTRLSYNVIKWQKTSS